MKSKIKFLGVFLGTFMFICILMQENVFAESKVTIKNHEDLANAIANQMDDQIWEIQAGTYTLTASDLQKYSSQQLGGQGNWYFPIYKNNITIQGVGGDVTITSDVSSENVNWASQDFISVWGDNVTIDGIKIKSKKEQNKAIEVMGKNVTLKNIDLVKVDKNGSGSIILNSQSDGDIGNATIENVKLYSWISANYSKEGTLTTKNVTIDFTDNTYAGYSDKDLGYAWRPLINVIDGITLDNSNFKLLVDDKINLTEQVFMDNLPENTTVVLTKNVAVDKMLNITKNNIILDLNGNTLTASDKFTNSWENNNDAHLLQVLNASNVTVKNGSIVTTDKNKHGINVFDSENVLLEDLKVDNTKTIGGAPIIINNSSVKVMGDLDLTIGEKSWYGINVDPKNGSASLSFEEGSSVKMTGQKGNQTVVQLDGDSENITVSGAEQAGLLSDGNGKFIIDISQETNNENVKNPNTKDNIVFYIAALCLSIVSIGIIIKIRKKNA